MARPEKEQPLSDFSLAYVPCLLVPYRIAEVPLIVEEIIPPAESEIP